MAKMVDVATALNMEGSNPFQKYVNFLLTTKFILTKNVRTKECLSMAIRIESFLKNGKENKILDLIINNFYTDDEYNLEELLNLVETIKEKYEEVSV